MKRPAGRMGMILGLVVLVGGAGCDEEARPRARAPAADPGFQDEVVAGPAAAQHRMVSVTRVDASGARVPGAGVEVVLRRMRQGMPGDDSAPVAIKTIEIKANAEGVADLGSLEPPRPRESDHIVARHAGVEWQLQDGQNMPQAIVWDVTEDLARLSIDLKVVLSPRDEGFLIDHIYTLTAGGARALDLRAKGVRIPLMLPALFGEPFEAGFLPDRPDERTFRTEIEPRLDDVKGASLKSENGALVLRTTIAPDRPVQMSVRAFVKYANEVEHTLAFRAGPVDLAGFLVFVERPERVGLRAALRMPADQTVQRTPEGERLVFIPMEIPKAGDTVRLDLAGSPERHNLVRPITTALALGLAALVTLTFLARRRREASPAS